MENKQPKSMPHGPKGKRQMGPMPKLKSPGKTIKRLLSFVLQKYQLQSLIDIVCSIVFDFRRFEHFKTVKNSQGVR